MEAFSLLKYWRTPSGETGGCSVITAENTTVVQPLAAAKTIFTSTSAASPESSDGEDGPYFDLEFAMPEDESDNEEESSEKTEGNYQGSPRTANGNETESENGGEELSESEKEDEEEEEEGEVMNITVTSDQNHELTLSPSEEVLFKGSLVSVEPGSIILNDSEENSRFPVFLLKSATKFRVLLLKLKKSKSVNGILEKAEKMEKIEANGHESSSPLEFQVKQSTLSGKFLTVMCKAEEVRMPLVSLFTKDNSSKSKHGGKCTKNNEEDSDSTAASEERKLTKEVVQKYIKMVKPLYVRVSKRYVEKLKFSGQLNFSAGASKRGGAVSVTAEKGGRETTKSAASSAGSVNSTHPKQASINNNLQAGLKVVRKHLGKSRSASAIDTPPLPPGKMASSRRDDSLLQIHDGIQGAILHCKKSFNATREVESSVLSRSVSDPSYEKSVIMSTDSSSSSFSGEETKDDLE
ncbi:probable membrane-associated kinase regulator 2 [Henckelia pumila]|uniref:probable membrane-associated kinase regulator 2 n=1 Tax=Henckelia pumila TaxID=405737 RepID=UPI003C6DC8E2